jgi:hypothetical protein
LESPTASIIGSLADPARSPPLLAADPAVFAVLGLEPLEAPPLFFEPSPPASSRADFVVLFLAFIVVILSCVSAKMAAPRRIHCRQQIAHQFLHGASARH